MDSDRILGSGIIIACVMVAILYFGSVVSPWWSFLTAVKVVVSIAFVVLLGIGGWIGWTMASTPSPEPVEDLDMEEIEEETPDFEESEEAIGASEEVGEETQDTKELQEDLSSIQGMTDSRMENLMDAGYDSPGSLKSATKDDLKEVEGIGSTLADRIKEKYL